MGLFVVDVESDGPIPPDNSMICFGAVCVEDLSKTFYGRTKPLPGAKYKPEALAVSGFTHEEHETFDQPIVVMNEFANWVKSVNKGGRPIMLSDNIAYDWQWINYYLHHFVGENIFGYSGRRISDLYCGLTGDMRAQWKHLRKTTHSHHPVADAIGNAEVLLHMITKMGLKT
jgi:hypothetical protein